MICRNKILTTTTATTIKGDQPTMLRGYRRDGCGR